MRFTPSATGNIIPSNTQYTWIVPQYSDPGLITGGTGLKQTDPVEYVDVPITQTLQNKSLDPQSATYNVYARAGSCISFTPFDLVVTVNPTPVLSLGSDTLSVCSGSAPSFIPSSPLPSNVRFNWATPILTPAGSFSGTGTSAQSNQITFAPIINNLRTTTSYADFTIVPTTTLNCTGSPIKIVVKVNPVANISKQNVSICSGESFNSTPNPVPLGTIYTWGSPSLTSGVSITTGTQNINFSGDTSIAAKLTYSGVDTGGVAQFTIVPKSGNCTGNPFTLVATIKPLPVVTTASKVVCSGSQFSTSPTSNLASNIPTSYTWDLPVISPFNALQGASANTSPLQSITQTLVDLSGNISQATYTVTPSAQGCIGKPFTFVATVNPTPIILNKDTTICPGTPFSMNPSPLPFITNYTWDAPVDNIPNAVTGGTGQIIPVPTFSQVLTNITNSIDVMSTYKVTPRFGECIGKPFSIVVTVKASPYITDTLVTTVCSGSAFTVPMPNNLPVGSLYRWDEPTYSNGITGGSPQLGLRSQISQILRNTNSDTTTGRAFYSVTPVANGCVGNSFIVKVNVKANSATLTSPLSMPAICSGNTFNYNPTSNFPGTAFIWSRDKIAGLENDSSSGYADISETLMDTTGNPVTVSYRFSLLYNGCVNAKTQTVTVVVNPMPVLTSSLQPTPICSEVVFNYTPVSSTRDVNFSWSRSYVVGIKEPLSDGNNSISEKLTNTTFNTVRVPYVFTLTANGCTNQQTIYEIVNPVLTLNDQTNAVCSGTNFSITPPNNVNAVFLWNRPALDNGLVGGTENTIIPLSSITSSLKNLTDYPASAVYDLTPIIPGASTGGCLGNPFKLKVVVNPIPVLSSARNLPDICSGTQFSYIPTSNTPGTIFTWTRDTILGLSNFAARNNFSIDEVLMNATTSPVKVKYTYRTTFNGCTDSVQFVSFTVNPAPEVPDQKITICSGTPFSVPAELEPMGTTYTWSTPVIFPSGALNSFTARTSPQTLVYDTLRSTISSNATAVYTVIPSYPNCALKPFNVFVTVKPIAQIGDQNAVTCNAKQLLFNPQGVPPNTLYKWKFNTANPSFSLGGYTNNDSVYRSSIAQLLTNFGSSAVYADYQVETSTNGCMGKSFQLKVMVNPSPKVSITGPSALCINSDDTLSLAFTGTSPWTINYIDNKDNLIRQVSGFTSPNSIFVSKNLPADSFYRFTVLNVSDAYCNSDTASAVTGVASFKQKLIPLPKATINAPEGTLICVAQFRPLVISPMASSYKWYRNDTLITNANSVNYNAFREGKYSAWITDSIGCSNWTTNTVQMSDLKLFAISLTNDAINCTSTLKQFLNQSDTSSIRNISWQWNFNGEDSVSGYHAMMTFKKSGLKKIRLSANIPSCSYSISKDTLIMIEDPVKSMNLETVSTNSARPIQLNARKFEGIPYSYSWKPSWGLNFFNVSNPVFNYNKTQSYYISMTAPSGCVTVDTLKVLVFDSAIVNIFIPRSFTPNGDGVNDILYPYIAGMKSLSYLRIFDKFGKLVFESRSTANGWNGESAGKPQPMDAYLWVAEGIDLKGEKIRQTGSVLLIR
jgi:gliding motility-associated-like protein